MIAVSYGIGIWKKPPKINLARKDFAHLTVAAMCHCVIFES